jgi:uncharacterized protein
VTETFSEPIEDYSEDGDLRPWLEVPQDDRSPFIHRFQTQSRKYVYDVNTRRIIHVAQVVWDVLGDFGREDERQIAAKYSSSYTPDEVAAAIREIDSARREKGLFLSVRPREIEPPSEKRIREQLDNRREQLILDVTEECNFRCSYCVFSGLYPKERTHSAQKMTWDVARPAIEEFLAHSSQTTDGRTISFYGGEPLLNLPLIRQCVEHVRNNYKDVEARFSLTTNGYLLKGDAARFLGDEKFLILVSLDGPEDIHDRNRRTQTGAPTWKRILSNLRDFLAAYPEYRTNHLLRFNAVATKTMDLCEAQRFWAASDLFTDSMGLEMSRQKQAGTEDAGISPGDPLAVTGEKLRKDYFQELIDGEAGKEPWRKSRWIQASIFDKPFVSFHKRGFTSSHLPEDTLHFLNHCMPGARRTFVRANGDYFACERVVTCADQKIGDVRERLNVERVIALVNHWVRTNRNQCRYCWLLNSCLMGCVATVGDGSPISEQAKRRACAAHRRNMGRLIVEYCEILEKNPHAFDFIESMEIG